MTIRTMVARLTLASVLVGCGAATSSASTSQPTAPTPSEVARPTPSEVARPTPSVAPTPAAALCVGPDKALGWDKVPPLLRRLGDAWMAPDEATRLAILDEIWSEDGVYVNQYDEAPVVGRLAVADYMAFGMANNYLEISAWDPGDMHNDRARIRWRDCCPDGTVLLTGTEFAEIDSDGRFSRVTSFWDRFVAEVASEACG